jgi:hypothetical protein
MKCPPDLRLAARSALLLAARSALLLAARSALLLAARSALRLATRSALLLAARSALLLAALIPVVRAGEPEAAGIQQALETRHIPYGMILDPVFAAPDSEEIIGYTRCGDSALWTGVWLASESYRYALTRSPEALANIKVAIDGIRKLIDVTGSDALARCAFPSASPWADFMSSEESRHGVHSGIVDREAWTWIGHTSRDQYIGVFFGLTAAYDFSGDNEVRGAVHYLVLKMLKKLMKDGWLVKMPDGISTTFAGRPDQQLALLKLGRRVDNGDFGWSYRALSTTLAPTVPAPVALDVVEKHEHYFKFHLDYLTFFMLLSGGDNSWNEINYRRGFSILRRTTDDHGNAFFDLVERAVTEPATERDARALVKLDEWLARPRRDDWVDLRGEYPACGQEDRACEPLPVGRRVRTDYLWQRSPFLLYGGGGGTIEGAGLDYLLPYWMARYYRLL